MRETQRRIQEYKKALPHMKERVVASVMLLVIAVSMVVSASFAWTTLSINPEISGLSTTISANGNLEIALSGIDGMEPSGTQVGDGLGDITQTNLRWGNLVNLSHESYGLDYLTLRPASLNTEALDISPMIAVNYGQDGRVQGYLKDFAFSNYNASAKVFDVFDTTRYGVRAISSVTYSNAHAESFYNGQLDKVTESMENAEQRFSAIYGNKTYMNTVTALVGIHVTAMMGEDQDCQVYMPTLNEIMSEVEAVRDLIGQTIVEIANLYLYDELADAGQSGSYESLAYELEDISANNYSNDFTRKYGTKIKGLTTYVAMSKRVDSAAAQMALASSTADGKVLWQRDLKKAVNYMCNVDKATIKTADGEYTCAQLAGSKSIAVKILLSGDTPLAIIKEGALRDADQLLGTEMFVEKVKVGVTLPDDFGYGMGGRTINITCNVQTSATAPYDLPNAYSDAYIFSSGATAGDRGTPVAADTYAMAIDFWVRTNEANSLLMLEGEVEYREEREPVMGYNENGELVPLYEVTMTVSTDDGPVEAPVEIYQSTADNGAVQWHNSVTHEIVDIGSARPVEKVNINKIPIGYSGVNRVWDELNDPNSDYSQMIQGGTSTTQGSGSCYIFYPETPEDQEQCKNLLAAMHIAFIDQHGNLLGYGDMDVDSMIEDAGRVIVPLKTRMQKKEIIVGQDGAGNNITESYYITPLVQNEAMRITAIVYLEGKNLSNSDVLSAGSINGQLNIQFGLNKMENSPLKDGPLMGDHYSITADLIHKGTGELAKRDDSMTGYNESTCVWDLEIGIAGTNPSIVRGQFVSYINASQGARQQEFFMTYNEERHKWTASVPFSGPGEFRLRSIEIDGVDILLPTDQMLYVIIPGKNISSLVCTNWGGDGSKQSVMTADSLYKQEVHLTLNSGGSAISKVQGVFIGEGKTVTVDFTTDAGVNYVGTATFTNGGEYTMTYVIIDDVYTPLDPSLYKTLSLKLNLQTVINLGLPVDDGYYDLIREMDAAMNAAATADEKAAIQADYEARIEAYLNVLHYGTGIAGDRNQNGLNLIRDEKGNMSFVTDCSKPLYFNVSCIITDDQGNMLTNLYDVELLYSAGGVSNKLDCDVLEVDKNAGYYSGRLTLDSNGMFYFNTLTFKASGQNVTYTIYGTPNAPTITAIQPAPMEYVTQNAYAPYVYDLGMPASERVLYIKLKNAAAASLDVTLTNGKGETAAPLAVTAGETDANGVTTFAIQVPSDGYWRITSVKAKNVFYNDVFYTGQADDPTTWLDLSQLAMDDEIATHYVTEAYIRVSGDTPAQSYTGAFMAPHEVSGMYVEVLGSQYGERVPLETVLASIGIDADVSFALKYALDLDTLSAGYTYTVANGGSMVPYEFNSTYDEAGNRANMGTMNFRLPGTYYPSWTVTIDATNDAYDYSYSYRFGTEKAAEFSYLNTTSMESVVMVSWNQTPDVIISAISPSGSHTSATSGWGLAWTNRTVTSSIAADKYSATVYPGIQKDGTLGMKVVTYPSATLKINNMGYASGATMTFANAKFYTSTSPSSGNYISYYEWNGTDTASRYLGYYAGGRWSGTSTPTGTVSSNQLQLKYGDMTFTFTLANTVTINNIKAG